MSIKRNYFDSTEFLSARFKYAIPIHYGTVAGSPDDGEKFRKAVDSGIEVVIKI